MRVRARCYHDCLCETEFFSIVLWPLSRYETKEKVSCRIAGLSRDRFCVSLGTPLRRTKVRANQQSHFVGRNDQLGYNQKRLQ